MCLKQSLGRIGEKLAKEYLEKNNHEILEKNFRKNYCEIDIIAYDKTEKELVFCEVKTRSNIKYGEPSESVTKQKQKNIINVAKYYSCKDILKDIQIRFDVIEVFFNNGYYKINHIKQAFIC